MNQFLDNDLETFVEGGPYKNPKDLKGKKWGYKDKNGNIIIEPKFDNADNFSEGLARVEVNGYWGYIDSEGNFVVEPKWTRAFRFNHGKAEVRNSNADFFFIDKTGRIIEKIK